MIRLVYNSNLLKPNILNDILAIYIVVIGIVSLVENTFAHNLWHKSHSYILWYLIGLMCNKKCYMEGGFVFMYDFYVETIKWLSMVW